MVSMKLPSFLLLFYLVEGGNSQARLSFRKSDGIEQFHGPRGCVPLKKLPIFLRSGNETYPGVEIPDWCLEHMTPRYLKDRPAEKIPSPYNISFHHFQISNAINITVKSDTEPIRDVFIIVRSVKDEETRTLGRPVGRFIPDNDTALACCNLVDRNGIEVIPQHDTTKVTVTWLPDGDYDGPVVATATVVNTLGKYWPAVRSEITIAYD